MKKPILLVLAAGLASRYGSLKQMEPLGQHGEVLLDYSAFDAIRAGFSKIVFVIRHDFEEDFRNLILPRIAGKIPVEIAFQELDSLLPAGATHSRTRPWGTVHAISCAAEFIDAPFAVINADDFYGKEAFLAISEFAQKNPDTAAVVPYLLENVLSDSGTVNRGYCHMADNYLQDIEEMYKVKRMENGEIQGQHASGEPVTLCGTTPVSMNFWLFPTSALELFQKYWSDFIAEKIDDPTTECLLATAVMDLITSGDMQVRAVPAEKSEWFGLTYKEDRPQAKQRLANLIAAGDYPENLWG